MEQAPVHPIKISVVTSLYRSRQDIAEFYRRIKTEAEKISPHYQIIFVNDCSPDDSLDVALAIHAQDSRVEVIDLSRNFGLSKAVMTGLAHARGELVFAIDSDLEEDPEFLGLFFSEMQRTQSDIVYGIQQKRKGGFFEVFSGALFYIVLNRVTSMNFPVNPVVARLMTRQYVQDLLKFGEQETYWGGLFTLTGHRQHSVPVTKHHRSPSTFTLNLKIHTALNALCSFSDKPVLTIFYLGSASFCASIAYLFSLLFDASIQRMDVALGLVFLLGSFILTSIGVTGIYLSRVLMEVKNRPYTLVRKHYRA